jgi:hypothetical protein
VTAAVDHAADADDVADLELRDVAADCGDAADDLVAGDAGVERAFPFALGVWRSEWQTPQNAMSIATSVLPGSRRSNENGASGVSGDCAA